MSGTVLMPHEIRFDGLHERLTELIRLYSVYLPTASVHTGGKKRIEYMIKMFQAIYDAVLKGDFLPLKQLAMELKDEDDDGASYLSVALKTLHDQKLADSVIQYLEVAGEVMQQHPEIPAHFGRYN